MKWHGVRLSVHLCRSPTAAVSGGFAATGRKHQWIAAAR